MSFDSELHERAKRVVTLTEQGRLSWDSDRYIDQKTGRILAMIELKSGYCDVLMNGQVTGQFVSSQQAKRWVEEQNL